jgi:hypothetical protein
MKAKPQKGGNGKLSTSRQRADATSVWKQKYDALSRRYNRLRREMAQIRQERAQYQTALIASVFPEKGLTAEEEKMLAEREDQPKLRDIIANLKRAGDH